MINFNFIVVDGRLGNIPEYFIIIIDLGKAIILVILCIAINYHFISIFKLTPNYKSFVIINFLT